MPKYQLDVTPTWDGAMCRFVRIVDRIVDQRVADERAVDLLLSLVCTEKIDFLLLC